jgi:FkbH-like protein
MIETMDDVGGLTDPTAAPDGDALRAAGRFEAAIDAYARAVSGQEIPPAEVCIKIARCHLDLQQREAALSWLAKVVDCGDDFRSWRTAAAMAEKLLDGGAEPSVRRKARVWLASSYTTVQFAPLLKLAALRAGIHLVLGQGDYGQYSQDVLDPGSPLYGFDPDVVMLALHDGDLALPDYAGDPAATVDAEVARWTGLWRALKQRSNARLVMHNFAAPPQNAFGHLATRTAGSRAAMLRAVNQALGQAAGPGVSILDCDSLSAEIGKRVWFDPRYWHLSKQAVSLEALPLLARHTAAVLAADLGLTKKCLVLDLDNTLWGGVIGEDGLGGIRLGQGDPVGEAFVAFQTYIKGLQQRGVILAVCSKNNPADARAPFQEHPEMVLKLDDFAAFLADWEPKSDNLRRVAEMLDLGLDALVFVDDNPAERAIIRQLVPEVDVVTLPADPAGYTTALGRYLGFESASYTEEDGAKTEQYRARAAIAQLSVEAESLDDFYRSLEMQAAAGPFDEADLPRIVQLLGKSNQFNPTTRRYNEAQVRAMIDDPDVAHVSFKLSDRFANHGLVGLAIGKRDGEAFEIDALVMSCRVIGRTVENEMVAQLAAAAEARGCKELRGRYIPTAKNGLVKTLYERLGFSLRSESNSGETVWVRPVQGAHQALSAGFISLSSDVSTAQDRGVA